MDFARAWVFSNVPLGCAAAMLAHAIFVQTMAKSAPTVAPMRAAERPYQFQADVHMQPADVPAPGVPWAHAEAIPLGMIGAGGEGGAGGEMHVQPIEAPFPGVPWWAHAEALEADPIEMFGADGGEGGEGGEGRVGGEMQIQPDDGAFPGVPWARAEIIPHEMQMQPDNGEFPGVPLARAEIIPNDMFGADGQGAGGVFDAIEVLGAAGVGDAAPDTSEFTEAYVPEPREASPYGSSGDLSDSGSNES